MSEIRTAINNFEFHNMSLKITNIQHLNVFKYVNLRYLTLLFFLYFVAPAQSQELNCTVVLNYDQLFAQQTTDVNGLNQLKSAISDFMNSKKWTNDNFSSEERINCKLSINLIKSVSQGSYEANAQIIVTRPVFGTTYETVIFSYVDRFFNFGYLPNNPMYFNENTYSDELTQLLGFYAYIILAIDYDSFSKQGGNPFVQRAFNLSNIAQNTSGGSGWKQTDIRSRFWLIENLMNQQFTSYRDSQYMYHRLALDKFIENPVIARRTILEVLTTIKQVNQLKASSVLINSFFDAKGEELVKILMPASKDERQKAFGIMSQLDPSKTEMYRKLVK
jgi:Domain of unknown function (DUF4835)